MKICGLVFSAASVIAGLVEMRAANYVVTLLLLCVRAEEMLTLFSGGVAPDSLAGAADPLSQLFNAVPEDVPQSQQQQQQPPQQQQQRQQHEQQARVPAGAAASAQAGGVGASETLSLSAGAPAAQGGSVAEQGTTAMQCGWPGDVTVRVRVGGQVSPPEILTTVRHRDAGCRAN